MSAAEHEDGLAPVLSIATLTRTHGVRGEMKLRATPEFVAFLRVVAEEAEPITLRMPESGDEYEVTFGHVRGHDSAPIVAIDGVEDRVAAERFRGALVCVPRDLLPPPEDDEYYLVDLQGCAAHDAATGERIGRVSRAEALPANVVLTVKLDAGSTVLVPLIDAAVPVVDIDSRRVDLDMGFLAFDEDEDTYGGES
ncbi:MAG: rimM [Thermoleophilia bacterium]|nr:rimM [Thermoleophilia bacterium]